MTEKEYLEKIKNCSGFEHLKEIYVFVQTKNELLRIRRGRGNIYGRHGQEGDSCQPYLMHSRYSIQAANAEKTEDKGIYFYPSDPKVEKTHGILMSHLYELFCCIYGTKIVHDEKFGFIAFSGSKGNASEEDTGRIEGFSEEEISADDKNGAFLPDAWQIL